MPAHLSFAQICAQAAGIEIVHDGLYMTETLALAAKTGKDTYPIARQRLKATQDFLTERLGEKRQPLELMGLPYDVRHLILEHLIGPQNIRVFLRRSSMPIRLPEAARAGNIQLRRECLLVALKIVEIHSGPGNASFQTWLSRIDPTGTESSCETGFDAITSLSFPYFSRFPYRRADITKNNDIGLALACRNLRSLTLDFHSEELHNVLSRHAEAEGNVATNCALDIRETYQLDGLLGATKLKKSHFRTGASEQLLVGLEEVVTWMDKGFQERGQKVVIEIH
ncbi:hypothetical protein Q7P35_012459 [Cladosporium inversicolor]